MSKFIDFYLIGELVDSHGNVHYDDLKNLPTIDFVRCKDCEFWQTDWIPNTGGDRGCHYCEMMDSFTEPLNYCGYAERKILPKH